MTMEFHTAYGKVPEKLVNDIRNEILELSHIYKKISRAEVLLKEDKTILLPVNKICKIRLTVYGDDLQGHARTENFKNSAKEVIKDLKRIVKQHVNKQRELPDVKTSTVKA
ncbi:MAG: HPF/RaiA family ribosome-associated protein [Ferruginibacter sp.]